MSEPIRTDINESYFHSERIGTVIESVGTMLALNNITERKIDPVMKGWTTLKDQFTWLSFAIKEENGQKSFVASKLDF